MGALRVGIVPGAEMSWVGQEVGIRKPMPFETPLSAAEVEFALKAGLIEPVLSEEEDDTVRPWVRHYIRSTYAHEAVV